MRRGVGWKGEGLAEAWAPPISRKGATDTNLPMDDFPNPG